MTFLAGIIEALHAVKERDCLVAEIFEVKVQIFRESQNASLRCASFHRILIDVENISFDDDKRLDSAKDTQFSVPLWNKIRHQIALLHRYFMTYSFAYSSTAWPFYKEKLFFTDRRILVGRSFLWYCPGIMLINTLSLSFQILLYS